MFGRWVRPRSLNPLERPDPGYLGGACGTTFGSTAFRTCSFQSRGLDEELRSVHADRRRMDDTIEGPPACHFAIATLRAPMTGLRGPHPQKTYSVYPPTGRRFIPTNANRTIQFPRGHFGTRDNTACTTANQTDLTTFVKQNASTNCDAHLSENHSP